LPESCQMRGAITIDQSGFLTLPRARQGYCT
jgi:hypothetical protein